MDEITRFVDRGLIETRKDSVRSSAEKEMEQVVNRSSSRRSTDHWFQESLEKEKEEEKSRARRESIVLPFRKDRENHSKCRSILKWRGEVVNRIVYSNWCIYIGKIIISRFIRFPRNVLKSLRRARRKIHRSCEKRFEQALVEQIVHILEK